MVCVIQKEAAVSGYNLSKRLAALEEKRRLQKAALLAWDSWVLLGLLAIEAAALCGYFGVVDWWNLQFNSAPHMFVSSLR